MDTNKTNAITIVILLLAASLFELKAQTLYQFEDPDLSFKELNLTGDTTQFLIEGGFLQLDAENGVSSAGLLFPSQAVFNASWQFQVQLDFNPSSSNYTEIFLISDADSLLHINNGYSIRIGGSEDDIRLYKTEDGERSVLIDGTDKELDLSGFTLDLQCTFDSLGMWKLYKKLDTDEEFQLVGSGADSSIPESNSFGIFCNFTSTRSDKFRFDNILIEGIPYPDVFPPAVDSLSIEANNELMIAFNEPVILDSASFEIVYPNYYKSDSFWIADNESSIYVNFQNELANGFQHSLVIKNITDKSGNILFPDTLTFLYYTPIPPQYRDILINEIFADPNPAEDLPEAEFIEIFNRSPNPQNLKGWILDDNRSSTSLDEYILLPDSILILTSNSNAFQYFDYGNVLAVDNWPTLNNNSDDLVIKSGSGIMIDSISYDVSFHEPEKSQGGWTLELINAENPCSIPSNWSSSIDPTGGTPGISNSVMDQSPDTVPPTIQNIFANDRASVLIEFSEAIIPGDVDIFSGPDMNKISSVYIERKSLLEWILLINDSLQTNVFYTFRFNQFRDCFDNLLNPEDHSISFDFDPPEIDSTYSIYHNQIDVLFNEDIMTFHPISVHFKESELSVHAEFNPNDPSHLILLLDSMILVSFEDTLILNDISDLSGNNIKDMEIPMIYQPPPFLQSGDIIITEFMADPVPSVGLPEVEYIEILNKSNRPFPLRGIKIEDSHSSGIVTDGIISPGEYVILCPENNYESFLEYGIVSGISGWPNLNSNIDTIKIRNHNGHEIFSIPYSKDLFQNQEKNEGGWSMELIDDKSVCLGPLAWKESNDHSGGTPGRSNSHSDIDLPSPVLIGWKGQSGDTILLHFDRKMDTNQSIENGQFSINSIPSAESIFFHVDSVKNWVGVKIGEPMVSDSVYQINITGLSDCAGQEIQINFEYHFDTSPPYILDLDWIYENRLELIFNEDVEITSMEIIPQNGIYQDSIWLVYPEDGRQDSVSIFFQNLLENQDYTLILNEVADNQSNKDSIQINFVYKKPPVAGLYDLIITEVMATPGENPILEFEYLEIYNASEYRISLRNYSLSDLNTTGYIGYEYLDPRSYLVFTSKDPDVTFCDGCKWVKVEPWPELNKSGDHITLKNSHDEAIFTLAYTESWYKSIDKKEGGWSLEMIDITNPCGEIENWISSENSIGGTPGKPNSVSASNPDLRGPEVLSVFLKSTDTIKVLFNEKIDPVSVSKVNIEIIPKIEIDTLIVDSNNNAIEIKLSQPVFASLVYELSVKGITDCNGNIIPFSQENQVVILPEKPVIEDIVINEILFNPRPGGVDFIELLNISSKYLDLKQIHLSNGKDTMWVDHMKILAPGEYVVFSEDPQVLVNEYPKTDVSIALHQNLPSFPDAEGYISIMAAENKKVIDELEYEESMHFELYRDFDGISLERISPHESSENHSNWSSASSQSEGATPGYLNSIHLELNTPENPLVISPRAFDPLSSTTPFTTIQYSLDSPGYVGTLEIYDLEGRVVKKLLDTDYLPQKGFITWEGTDNRGVKVSTNTYIVLFMIFNLEGKMTTFKDRVVVATRF